MNFLRKILDNLEPLFKKGGKFESLYPLYEAGDTFLYTPNDKTKTAPFVRDHIDLKRTMILVVMALMPCLLFGIYNVGHQYYHYVETATNATMIDKILIGLQSVIPIYIVTFAVGGLTEVIFAIIRKHEVNEGFLVTGFLIPLVMPPSLPLWMVAISTIFGVVIGKEIFGGTGYNIFNPALTARAFLFFAYPAHMSGDNAWVAKPAGYYPAGNVDTYITQATPLGDLANAEYVKDTVQNVPSIIEYSWWDMFVGFVPGSIGETSTICILIGALFLIVTGIGSWRTMFGCVFGMLFMTLILNYIVGPLFAKENLFLFVGPHWHLVIGSFAFGTVFMATDPVSSAHTERGRYYYGFLIGVMGILIRVLNPAYPEGMMLAILFANAFAPLIDYYVVKGNIKRRELRSAGR